MQDYPEDSHFALDLEVPIAILWNPCKVADLSEQICKGRRSREDGSSLNVHRRSQAFWTGTWSLLDVVTRKNSSFSLFHGLASIRCCRDSAGTCCQTAFEESVTGSFEKPVVLHNGFRWGA